MSLVNDYYSCIGTLYKLHDTGNACVKSNSVVDYKLSLDGVEGRHKRRVSELLLA